MNKLKNETTDKRMPFTVPEEFFEALPERVVARVHKDAVSRRGMQTVRRVMVMTVPLAACVVIGVMLLQPVGQPQKTKVTAAQTAVCSEPSFDKFLEGLSDEEISELAFQASVDPAI